MFLDDSAYTGRSLYKYIDKSIKEKIPNIIDGNFEIDQDKTSFGNVSIQVRRAIDTLEYNTSTKNRGKIIDSLKDPVQNIYIAAAHLKKLKDIDFKESAADKLTDDEIKIIASRYNVGPEPSLEEMRGSTDYGTRIYDNQDEILTALGLLPQSTKEQNIL